MTVQCCKCKRVKWRGTWVPEANWGLGEVSHTYCPVCVDETLQEIRKREFVVGNPTPVLATL